MTSENQGELVPASETRLTHLIGPGRRGLTARHLQFIAIGGAIGSGLFLGSAAGIRSAGPALLFAYAPRLLSAQRLLLMEANFRPGEHEAALAGLLTAGAAQLAQVLCRADAVTCAARLAARAEDPSRHPGHRDREIDAAAGGNARFLDLPGPRWLFSGDSPGEGEWLALCRHIDQWKQ